MTLLDEIDSKYSETLPGAPDLEANDMQEERMDGFFDDKCETLQSDDRISHQNLRAVQLNCDAGF